MFKGFHIAASGMAVQRHRIHLVGSNLANVSTTRTEDGGPYQRQEAIVRTTTPIDTDGTADVADLALRGVRVDEVVTDESPGPLVYDPDHPDADADGNVALPNVNPMEEMVDMITASRSFEANVQAFQTLRDMMNTALELGR